MTKALLYVRTSPGRPVADWLSEDAQLAALRAYCLEHEFEVVGTYIDDVPAQDELRTRPSGASLKASLFHAEEEPWTLHVVAVSSCRLTCSPAETLAFATDLVARKTGLHLVRAQVELNRGPSAFEGDSGEAWLTFLRHQVEAADRIEHEREQAARRRDGRRSIRGAAPYGFTVRGGRVRPEPGELRILGRVYELRQAGLSYRDLAGQLAAEGAHTRTGGLRFTPSALSGCQRRLEADPDLRERATAALAKSRRKRGAALTR
ncbi:MAG: recombinase family protein [Planctomycetes bacterium]|nr:recombinase family protein [Planctomycetota bacterium]